MAVLLDNPVRSYAWGATNVLSELQGREPSGEPEAELWVGAHPAAPSVVTGDGRTLDRYIADDPVGALGERVVERFGSRLPFLLKVLAVAQPLSIQVHPTTAQAEQGYDAEDAAGVPLDARHRSYRDRHHKPEMLVALSEFDALLGFDDPADCAEALETCEHTDLVNAAAVLRGDDGLEKLVERWLALPEAQAEVIVEALRDEAVSRTQERFAMIRELGLQYPTDRGLLLAFLMRRVRLEPGQAVFVPAGVPHVYLSGTAVEAQASSDNTLRAGLTVKHVDTTEVGRLLRYDVGGALPVEPQDAGDGRQLFPVPGVDDFLLCRVELSRSAVPVPGPRIILVIEGEASLRDNSDELVLRRGQSAFVPAADTSATMRGEGVAFTLTTGLDTAP